MPKYKHVGSYDAGGDLSKEWFVSYHFLKPEKLRKPNEPLYQRFRVCKSINSVHTLSERKRQLKIVKEGIKTLLGLGFNPFHVFKSYNKTSLSKYNIINCIDNYLLSVKSTLKRNSFRVYENRLLLLKQYLDMNGFSMLNIDDVTKQMIFEFVNKYRVERSWSNKTYNSYINDIQAFMGYYVDNYDDYLKTNPCKKIKRLSVVKKGNIPFDNRTLSDVLNWTKEKDPYLYQFCRFIYYSCLRPDAELRLLKVGDIDLVSRRIMAPSDNTKSKRTQWIPIDDEFAQILRELNLHQYKITDYIFTSTGTPGPKSVCEGYFRKRFIKVRRAIYIPEGVTLYAFKHTRCIHMVEDGVKLTTIIKYTRHSTLAELMDYLKDMGIIIGEEVSIKSRKI
ncbi:tyrosine-type recombinase/integrase [Parapedobacter indicus]|uniref:Site-specific recombinase XerD n=1 Tax=Parapedobacter indicus TaxID=1477437 RepID=A0A1I3RL69_9SPHI|nr:tyrosine-type recombinase/integrase [Parapedobacter indicus]PPL00112.1 site-specific recombinase XerD [Parapedobacter indicus]SFJ45916.1 Site-specific recombinase XerD [Parapedobacter indicus]